VSPTDFEGGSNGIFPPYWQPWQQASGFN